MVRTHKTPKSDIMNPKIKLIFFDMEGVIFETGIKQTSGNVAASLWKVIHNI